MVSIDDVVIARCRAVAAPVRRAMGTMGGQRDEATHAKVIAHTEPAMRAVGRQGSLEVKGKGEAWH